MDSGLALAFAGMAYLVWAMVAGTSRTLIQDLIHTLQRDHQLVVSNFTQNVKIMFVDFGVLIDLVGLAWMVGSLLLVVFSSRQKISISWAWVCSSCQMSMAAAGAVLVGWAAFSPHSVPLSISGQTIAEKVSGISLPVVLVAAMVLWVGFMVWLLVERARHDRRGPTLRDSLHTNA